MYAHNEDTFRELWKVVGEKTGTRWRAEVTTLPSASLDDNKAIGGLEIRT
jgi:hypothetical protein